MYLFIFT